MFEDVRVGSGIPFGGPHSNKAVSPLATRVSLGCARKSSRKTVTIATKIDINTLANVSLGKHVPVSSNTYRSSRLPYNAQAIVLERTITKHLDTHPGNLTTTTITTKLPEFSNTQSLVYWVPQGSNKSTNFCCAIISLSLKLA
uniref:Uncharacterized protein n=1 Tax=Glossina pallidipes TaxID=7398 RepID=A0A1B0AH23_GLOPL